MEVLHCGNRDFRPFCFCDLELDPMTFIYELDPYSLKIYWMRKYKLSTLRPSKLSSDRQTDCVYVFYLILCIIISAFCIVIICVGHA